MESGASFASLDLEAGERFVALRRQLGVESFGLSLMLLEPGQRGRVHRHERQEEVYIVLEARSRSSSTAARSTRCSRTTPRASGRRRDAGFQTAATPAWR